jgi:hypothetical protein
VEALVVQTLYANLLKVFVSRRPAAEKAARIPNHGYQGSKYRTTLLAFMWLMCFPAHSAELCVNPTTFGAIPNDGLDDREAFQAAINSAKALKRNVCIGPGQWDFTKPNGVGQSAIASVKVYGVKFPLQIYGVGPTTQLKMLGSGNFGDWRLLEVGQGSENVTLRDLHLDGELRTNTEEQTHLLQVTGPTQDLRVMRVTFNLPQIPGVGGGDCIRLLGDPAALVKRVRLFQVTGIHCDRSFIALQRGLSDISIDQAVSIRVGDQAVDSEPTGGFGMERIQITNSTFARGTNSQGPYTVTLGGGGVNFSKFISVANTSIVDGGIHIIDAQHVKIVGVKATGNLNSAGAVLHIRKRAHDIHIARSEFTKPVGALDGDVVTLGIHNGHFPRNVSIIGSKFFQNTASLGLRGEVVEKLSIRSSVFAMASVAAAFPVISSRGLVGQNVSEVVVENNIVGGPSKTFLRVARPSGAPNPIVRVRGNIAFGVMDCGVDFNGNPPTSPAPEIAGNNFGTMPDVCM